MAPRLRCTPSPGSLVIPTRSQGRASRNRLPFHLGYGDVERSQFEVRHVHLDEHGECDILGV
jgi:hypothetical protein